MLADAIEAATRTLSDPTPARLENLINNIVRKKMMDGQLDNCNLTLQELHKIREAFLRVLMGIFHARVKYPEAAEKE